jgi:hypothetical protein
MAHQINPARIDKARQALALRRTRQACCRQVSFLRFSNTFDVIFASISAMRPKGDGMVLGMPRTLPVLKVSF